jgi:uncharacterized protein (AIM24 family)
MVTQNLLYSQNAYVKTELGGMQVIEYARDMSVSPYTSKMEYFMAQMNVNKRQVLLNLNGNSYTIQAGAMQWMSGQVTMQTGVTGVGNFLGKMVSAAVTKESAVKPIYSGYGQMMLEPTYRHILLTDVADWGGSIVLDDGLFLACDSNLKQSVVARSNLSSAVFGGEGLFNLSLNGQGVAALESYVPMEELIEVNLQNDVMKIDGNMAIAWSGSLEFTTETATRGLINSAISKEGLVNVYRGTGRIWLAPVFSGNSAGAQTAGDSEDTESASPAQTGTAANLNSTINKIEKVGKILDLFNN